MDLQERFIKNWKEKFPAIPLVQCRFIAAVSGGVDSMVLLDLLIKSGAAVTVAHCNFQLRGPESTRDEYFVRSLENDYDIPVLVKKFDTANYAASQKIGIQEAARDLRYAWFAELIAGSEHPSFLLTAHQADDNIETLLIHFFRGTGILGLTGIPEADFNNRILRPLLFAKREAVLEYAVQQAISWVEDASNASVKYTRNHVRHHLLPHAKELFSGAEDNLLHNIERFKEVEILYNQSVTLHKLKMLEMKGEEWQVPVLKWKKAVPLQTLTWEIIKPFSFSSAQVGELIKLLDADNGSFIKSSSHRIIKNRNWMIIAPVQTDQAQHIVIEATDKKIAFENGTLSFEKLPAVHASIDSSNMVALMDANKLEYPLLLRKCKQGDYFYPLGMKKKKKLSKFFIDQKLSRTQKEKIWVLESNKRIAWITGLRIDDRFKITATTQNAVSIQLEPRL